MAEYSKGGGTREQQSGDEELVLIMKDILIQLRILNTYMSEWNGNVVKEFDIFIEDESL